MASIGPALPPHLVRGKKRTHDIEVASDPKPSQHIGAQEENQTPKRARVMGPALPSSRTAQHGSSHCNPHSEGNSNVDYDEDQDDDDDDDDDFGPALPKYESGGGAASMRGSIPEADSISVDQDKSVKPQRDTWMLAPPIQDSHSARADPTKLRNRKFNTGKGAKAPSQAAAPGMSLWTETPEERKTRLQDEIMGTAKVITTKSRPLVNPANDADTKTTDDKIREYNIKNRNASLYTQHAKFHSYEEEDDPSKRSFDKEKDIRGGSTISHTKRREMLSKAADFGSRFSKGSYL